MTAGTPMRKVPSISPITGTPWAIGSYLRALLAASDHQRATLLGGGIRAETLRNVQIGSEKDELTAYAIWGRDVAPQFVLARKDRLVATLSPRPC